MGTSIAMNRSKRAFTALLVLAVVSMTAGASAQEPDARAVVAEFQNGLLGVMKDAKALGVNGRFDRLLPVIDKAFGLPVMVATVTAPYWRSASAAQQAKLLAAFRRMSVASTATLFDDYGGETFRIVGERKGRGPTELVDTQIVLTRDDPVDVTYVAAKIRDRWRIIDIVVDKGISELATRRSDYQNLLREGGIDRLTAALEQKADNLLAGKEKARAEGARR
jgi:phospholipid transport system substrate-binding protein